MIVVASRQHRIAALSQYQTFLNKAKSESVRARKHLEKKILDNTDDMEIDEENNKEKPKWDEIEGSIAFGGQWIVAIYDLGESISDSYCSPAQKTIYCFCARI